MQRKPISDHTADELETMEVAGVPTEVVVTERKFAGWDANG